MDARTKMGAALASVLALAASPGAGRAAAENAVLVELFTSEGCSSCPPADALLARLAGEPLDGLRVIALSEHVDYWDDLGWRDRFSSRTFTERQGAYARRLGLSSIYTPQLVAGGRAQALGSDERAARQAILSAARDASGRVTARVSGAERARTAIHVEAAWMPAVAADVLVAFVQSRASTRVARGENAGRTLEHVAVVRSIAAVGSGAGTFSGTATIRRADAPDADRVVVFVQERDGGPVHAAAMIELP